MPAAGRESLSGRFDRKCGYRGNCINGGIWHGNDRQGSEAFSRAGP
jgi:hypothetical protein